MFTWSLSPWLWAFIGLVPRLSAIVADDDTLVGLAFAFALGTFSFEGGRQGRLHRGISLQALMRTNATIKPVARSQKEKALHHKSPALPSTGCHLGPQRPCSH